MSTRTIQPVAAADTGGAGGRRIPGPTCCALHAGAFNRLDQRPGSRGVRSAGYRQLRLMGGFGAGRPGFLRDAKPGGRRTADSPGAPTRRSACPGFGQIRPSALAARRAHDGAAVHQALLAAAWAWTGASWWAVQPGRARNNPAGNIQTLQEQIRRRNDPGRDMSAGGIRAGGYPARRAAGSALEHVVRPGRTTRRRPPADASTWDLLVDTTGVCGDLLAGEVVFVGKSLCQRRQNVVEAKLNKRTTESAHELSGVMEDLLAAVAAIRVQDRIS